MALTVLEPVMVIILCCRMMTIGHGGPREARQVMRDIYERRILAVLSAAETHDVDQASR